MRSTGRGAVDPSWANASSDRSRVWKGSALTKYLISFNEGAMDFSEEELAIVIEVASRDDALRWTAPFVTCH